MANPPITIGELTNVPAPGSGVKSAWAQDVTNRIVQRFATAAARLAAYTAPGRGAPSYIAAGNETEGPEYWDGVAWRRPWNMPWGRMSMMRGQGQIVTTGGTEVALFTSPAFAAPGNRWYKITADFTGTASVAGDVIRFGVRRGATVGDPGIQTGPAYQAMVSSGYLTPFVVIGYDIAPANAALQYTVGVARMSGTGVFTLLSTSSYYNGITVEDIGPAAGVAPT